MKRILNHIPTRNLAVVAVLLAAVGRAASTQEATGNLEGRVASVDGAGLASVTVTASGPSLQRPRQMSTDERGYTGTDGRCDASAQGGPAHPAADPSTHLRPEHHRHALWLRIG